MQAVANDFNEPPRKPTSTGRLLREVIASGEDFEWYPTTDAIIETVKNDIDAIEGGDYSHASVLDCGAGDGRVLKALTQGDKYAIEKSKPLIAALGKDIYIVGTEFEQQTLIDKKIDVLFSNPPYSQFCEWSVKIIREANAAYIYLVIPTRWRDSVEIADAIKAREAEYTVLGSFDFVAADRPARANIDIVRINLSRKTRHYNRHSASPKVDPFDLWFDQYFKINANQSERSQYAAEQMAKDSLAKKIENVIVEGGNLIATLDNLYQRDLAGLIETYQAVCKIDGQILKELDVNIDGLKAALQKKIEGLKDRYWKELFDNLSRVTNRLTTKSRAALLEKLGRHTHIDFTQSNAHALLVWVIKNANAYFDSQLIDVVETMTEKANVVYYKSNQHVIRDEQWRYCRFPDGLTRYKIDYRLVLARVGGLVISSWNSEVNGLSQRAADFIDDIRAVASNLGFDLAEHRGTRSVQWAGSDNKTFEYRDSKTGKNYTLLDVRAFKNGNLHVKLNQDLLVKLNCEFGRLKGWVSSPKEAADELDIKISDAVESFGTNYKLDGPGALMLGCNSAE